MMYFQVAAGLVILLVCGELLVRGSVALAEQMGISKLVIGFTIVFALFLGLLDFVWSNSLEILIQTIVGA